MHWLKRRQVSKASVPALILTVLVLSFQNCSSEIRDDQMQKANFEASSSQTEPSLNPLEGIVQADYSTFQNSRLKANLFTLYKEKDSFSRFSVTISPKHGTLQILDHRSGKFIFDPDLDYVGVDEFAYDETTPSGDVRSRVTKIYIVRSSMLGDIKPALAVRAMGCIGCHSNIASNIITDFGVGGDGTRDYSFGKLAVGKQFSSTSGIIGLNSGNVYFDHAAYAGLNGANGGEGNLSTLNMAAGTQIILPKNLNFPSDLGPARISRPDKKDDIAFVDLVNSVMGNPAGSPFAFSVKQYLQSLSPGLLTKSFPKLVVGEVKSVYIGAPTKARLAALRDEAKTVAAPTGTEFVYVKESKTSPDLAGIELIGDTLYAHDGFTCDGDLFISRKLVIEDMTLKTNQGCRIYSPEIVYMQGRVQYEAGKTYANIQISSARAIMVGLGSNTCGDANTTDTNSLFRRLHDWWTPSMFSRSDDPTTGPVATEDALYQDSKNLALDDARCIEKKLRAAGKLGATDEIVLDRVLFNAPKVHVRYRGNISGVIIAEIAFLAISNVKYNFNDVFTYVPVLPMLSPSDYLMVIDQ